jgi:hypothetical protein
MHGYKPHDRHGRPAGHLSAVQGVEAGLRKQGKDRPLVRAFLLHYIFIVVLIDPTPAGIILLAVLNSGKLGLVSYVALC